ncbi:chemotaxis protein CheW [Desulforegula conservatrix]|uniref:chemotaxis protein CheW n=1 Tax=Desulforegula conservatrix TaxID=153026 RepID=UPI0003FA9ABA|nr:chemotaxis protein CheW [Desulforegula conservatrix]
MSSTETIQAAQYLTYRLEDEVFAVDVAKVREILDYTPATKIPGTPDFISGIINVRGSVIPVVNMRIKFGLPNTEKTVNTCIVVMEIGSDEEKTILGALVDSVQEVFELEAAMIEPPPKMGTRLKTEYIKGIGKRNNELIIILDIDRVFSNSELMIIKDNNDIQD